MNKKALAIITYARFDYLELVLPSILHQTIRGRPVSEMYDVFVFQDGLYEGESESNRLGHEKISRALEKLPSEIKVIRQKNNLAVAFHFDFIERLLFVEKSYDFVVFFEDDLILAPGYLSVIDMMAEKFHNDPRVGMVSAHPGNPTIPLEQQTANRHKFATMGHNWGFGLSRSFWQKRQPLVDCYLDLIRDVPYRKRPHQAVYKWLELAGFSGAASSQDYIKQCATVALGACRLSTYVNFGLPIGRTGLHCKPEEFKKMGFDRTVVYDQDLDSISDLDDDQYQFLYEKQGHQVGENFVQAIRDPGAFDLHGWQTRLKAGEFHPKRLLPEIFEVQKPSFKVMEWKASDIPARPHMEIEGITLLEERLSRTEIYLEYGAGGSTVLAAELGVKKIHSVESDLGFLEAVKTRVAESCPSVTMIAHYVDIGPTKEWGQPTDSAFANRWPKYCVAAWDTLQLQGQRPDLILIDGRFRVACFLASLINSEPGAVILFDDYFDRPHYHVVEKYLRPCAKAGRMAEFVVDSSFSPTQVILDLMVSSTNPA